MANVFSRFVRHRALWLGWHRAGPRAVHMRTMDAATFTNNALGGTTPARSQHGRRIAFISGGAHNRVGLPPPLPPGATRGSRDSRAVCVSPRQRATGLQRNKQCSDFSEVEPVQVEVPLEDNAPTRESGRVGARGSSASPITVPRWEGLPTGWRRHSDRPQRREQQQTNGGRPRRVYLRRALNPPGRGRAPGWLLGPVRDHRMGGKEGKIPPSHITESPLSSER